MKRFHLVKESLLATVLTLIATFTISFIPLKFEFLKGIRQGFLGFDIYDLYFSGKHLKNTQRDSNIVLIEIGNDRESIAGQINLIQKYSPAVIGIDAVFEKENDPISDLNLLQALDQKNIILASRIIVDPESKHATFIHNFFEGNGHNYSSGYINFLGNQFSVIRNYPPFLKDGDSVYSSFTSAIARIYSPEKYNRLKKRDQQQEIINYKGNLESYTSISKEGLQYYDTTSQLGGLLANKIILLGYFVKDPPLVMDDLHFSPLNEEVAGKSFPDMYGVVVNANILSMILQGNYLKQASNFTSYLLATIFIFWFLYYIMFLHAGKKHTRHGKLLLIQFLLIIFILYLFLQVFNLFHIKVPLLPIMLSLVLSVELLGVYRNIALWLHRKYQYKTVFLHKHII